MRARRGVRSEGVGFGSRRYDLGSRTKIIRAGGPLIAGKGVSFGPLSIMT